MIIIGLLHLSFYSLISISQWILAPFANMLDDARQQKHRHVAEIYVHVLMYLGLRPVCRPRQLCSKHTPACDEMQ